VAGDLHYDALINALSKQQSGRGVPGIMNPHPADSGGFEQIIPFVPVGVGADWPPVGLAPDEVAVVPDWPRGHAFLELGGPVCFESRHELRWERDRASALGGFQLGEVKPAAGSLRAGPGVPDAATRAVVAVVVFPAGVRVGAAAALTVPAPTPLPTPRCRNEPFLRIKAARAIDYCRSPQVTHLAWVQLIVDGADSGDA